jgi:glycosyltransferase involved in cell wall biosynthesis
MDYRPNVDAALFFYREVFPLIRRKLPETRLVIAGRNPDRSIVALGVDPAVKVTGSVADMRPYIWGAAAAVVPLRIARGVQNKILEALAAGIPVVSTTVAAMALPEEIRGLVSIADTSQDISACVIRSLEKGPRLSSERLRATLKNYIDSLNLHSQFERILLAAEPRSGEPENLRRVPAVALGHTAEEMNQ